MKLTRDSKAIATDSIEKSSDGKTITINCSASLVDGTYVVTVGELTREFTCETSKVDTIEFLSDKAAVVETVANSNKYDKATVGYRVLNQFGDDITKTTMLTVNASVAATLNASDHQITFTAPTDDGFMLGRDMITCVLLDTNTGKNQSATLTCDMKAYAKTLTFEGIYNQDGKALTEDTNFNDDPFFMLFTAVDQYGQTFKNYKQVTEGTDIYVTVVGGLTAVDRDPDQTFGTVDKDGKTYLAYPLTWNHNLDHTAGTVTVQALSSGGASCSGTFEVTEGGRPVSITAVAPAVVPAGEKTEISYTALDAAGKEVTAYKYLKASEVTISGSNYVSFVRQADGSAKLILDARSFTVAKNNRTPVTFTMQTKNHKISTLTLYVTENARPVAIDGLQDVTTSFDKNTSYVPVKLKNLKVEDQYGRVMSADALQAAARITDGDDRPAYALRTVKATVVGTGIQVVSLTSDRTSIDTGAAIGYNTTPGNYLLWTEVTSAAIATANLGDARISKDDVLFYVKASSAKIGFANINFAIDNALDSDHADYLNSTNANVQFNVKDTGKVETATVEVKDIYTPTSTNFTRAAAYKQKVVVKANGVTLPTSSYSVEDSADFNITTDTIDGTTVYAIYAKNAQDTYEPFTRATDRKETLTKQITITLNGTGEKIVKDVVLSAVAPKVATVTLVDGGDSFNLGLTANSPSAVFSNEAIYANIKEVKDQYGVKLNLSTGAAVGTQKLLQYSFAYEAPGTNSKSAIVTFIGKDDYTGITDNGTSDATMRYNAAFTGITMDVNYGGVSQQIKIYR